MNICDFTVRFEAAFRERNVQSRVYIYTYTRQKKILYSTVSVREESGGRETERESWGGCLREKAYGGREEPGWGLYVGRYRAKQIGVYVYVFQPVYREIQK